MPLRSRLVSTAWTIALLSAAAVRTLPADNAAETARYRASICNHPAIARYYTFESTSNEKPLADSVAGQAEPAEYKDQAPLEIVPGAVVGSKAVRLDRGYFQAKPVELPERQFTLEMRFRKYGQGELLGNGRTNGMLFAQGDGYWSGLRIYTDYPNRSLRFEVGRPQPSNAFGMSATDGLPDGVWHHLAATWDGNRLRLYVDGLPAAAVDYAGEYTPTTGTLRIGYANAGIGSLKMDVDEVAVYTTALSAERILLHAYFHPQLPAQAEQRLLGGVTAMDSQDWSMAAAVFGETVATADAPPLALAVARLGLARCLQRQGSTAAAIAQYAALYDDASAPAPLREIAVRHCLPTTPSPANAIASSHVYQRLLELGELTADQQRALRLTLADALLRDGDAEGARTQYRAVMDDGETPELLLWDVRLGFGHTHLSERNYAAARRVYQYVADLPNAPPAIRGLALLSIGHAWEREGNYPEAAKSFSGTADRQDLLPHHRREASERSQECARLAQGLPARDPAASRTALPACPEPAVRFYVAADGDDANPGDQQRPFASLQRARDAIRSLKQAGPLPAGGVTVLVGGGDYAVRSSFELTAADSGTADVPIVYQALPGERPRFRGGVTLTGFSPVRDAAVRQRLAASSRDRVLQLDLKANGVTDLGSIESRGYGAASYPTRPWVDLYVDGAAMQLARWPNSGSVKVGKVSAGGFNTDQSDRPGTFEFADSRPTTWQATDDAWMFGAWGHLWAGRYVRIAAIDAAARRVSTVHRCSYGYREGQPYYYLNVLEELDQPGEWYLDRTTGVLYLIPPETATEVAAEFPLHASPFVMATDVSHVTLQGLTFELGRAEGAVITGGERVLLAGCRFGKLGANGVVIQGGHGHGLLGCDIYTLGAGGVRVAGGDMKTLEAGTHFVENCHIRDFSRVDRVYAPAIHLDGVGHRVAHNLMHDSPHHAMRVEGHEHVIEYNEIHSVVYEFDDQAGIDIYGNPAYRGIKIRYNFWHHIGSGHNVAGQAGIRLDDYISSVEMTGNVFYRSAGGRFGGIQIHGGKDNIAENNLFIDCKSAFSFSPWGQSRWEQRLAEERTRSSLARAGGDREDGPLRQRYPDLAQMTENADRNFLWRNLAVDCPEFAMRDRGVNELLDNHTRAGDPGFADPAARDFSLPADSAIYDRFNFRPIPFGEIGLYEAPTRASWPVQHEITPHYVNDLSADGDPPQH